MNTKEKRVVIYGASGHGKVVADIVTQAGGTVLAFIDDNNALWGQEFFGHPVWGGPEQMREKAQAGTQSFNVLVAIGNNSTRRRVSENLEQQGFRFASAIHPSAQIARGVSIGAGTVVMANCAVNPDAAIGSHCIINTGVTVDHDCVIGDFCHLSPGAHLGGTVRVGPSSWIGLGASVINNIDIGENVTVGAGAVVIRNIEAHSVVVGNPALRLRKNTSIK